MSAPVTDSVELARPMLFQPFKIRGLTLKNRLVVPPMVHYRAGPGNTCGSFHHVHLGRYALGGFGLVFVEATAVEEVGLINEHDLGIWNDPQVQSFKPLIAFMKGENTAIGVQLAHGGRKSSSQRASARTWAWRRWRLASFSKRSRLKQSWRTGRPTSSRSAGNPSSIPSIQHKTIVAMSKAGKIWRCRHRI